MADDCKQPCSEVLLLTNEVKLIREIVGQDALQHPPRAASGMVKDLSEIRADIGSVKGLVEQIAKTQEQDKNARNEAAERLVKEHELEQRTQLKPLRLAAEAGIRQGVQLLITIVFGGSVAYIAAHWIR